jgi:hypothetical protein
MTAGGYHLGMGDRGCALEHGSIVVFEHLLIN